MINGGFAYKYLFMSQHPNVENIFKDLLLNIQPKRILEIGTFHGGLTLCLRDILDNISMKDITIKTYDINDQAFLRPLAINRNIDIITKNLFDSNYTNFKDELCKYELEHFIKKNGITLVLCDGGNKINEFKLIAPLLKSGDIIMAHDYAPSIEYFNKYMYNTIWDWCEITNNDIAETCEDNNLYPIFYDKLLSIAWHARQKTY